MESVTFAIAVLGAVLGIISTWHSLDRSRIKLKVLPAHAIPVGNFPSNINFCIEITNLSEFPLTVREAGLLYKGDSNRGALTNPIVIDGGSWPRRLEPRTSVTLYACLDQASVNRGISCAYAKTDCGILKKGKSPALKQLAGGVRL